VTVNGVPLHELEIVDTLHNPADGTESTCLVPVPEGETAAAHLAELQALSDSDLLVDYFGWGNV